jgi:MoaA/NifB/PqqE/SkfB family radical SAM enzyme
MDYDNKGIEWCQNKLKSCNCKIEKIKNQFIYANYNNMKILYYTDWQKYTSFYNRGGSLKDYTPSFARILPCIAPQYFIGINYDGTVSPCCNIRNDIDFQKPYILGDIHNKTLTEILNSEKRLKFIKDCANAKFDIASPCYNCFGGGGRYIKEKGGIDYE